MKQFIRYLYEYEHGKRVRNIGFVKVEQGDERCVIHIHGKGFAVMNEKVLELFIFHMEHRRCVGIPQGEIDKIGPGINYRLEYGVDDVGNEDIFNNVKGIIISNHSNHKYAAVWDDTPIDIDEMLIRREPPSPRMQEAMEEKVLHDVREKEIESVEEEQETLPKTSERGTMDMAQTEQVVMEQEVPEIKNTVEPVNEHDMIEAEKIESETLDQYEIEQEEQSMESQEESDQIKKQSEPEYHMQKEDHSYNESDTKQSDICYEKIKREELSRLPRKEWRHANNHFLLHAYHNYNHLVFIKENGYLFLGVPGVFHEREQQAARAFGFPQFHRPEYPGIELSPEEKNEQDDFGYWCRQVEQMRV